MPSSATETKSSSRSVAIRQATPDDLGALRELLSLRDERAWDQASVSWFVSGLDPDQCLAWLAEDGDKPIGLTTMFLRELAWKNESRRVAYWANLFIHPDYRDLMLYPRLPMAMFAAIRGSEIEFLYGAVRLRDVARAHLGIGFAKLGEIRVLFKPLRPGRLLAKHKKLGRLAAAMSGPADAAFGTLQRLRRAKPSSDLRVDELPLETDEIESVVDLINRSGGDRIRQVWTAQTLRYRYQRTREGGQYIVLTARSASEILAVVVFRYAERGNHIHACALLDVAFRRGDERAARVVLAEAEHRARDAECELMLFLNGLGRDTERVLRQLGYRPSSEVYDLLIWPKTTFAAAAAEMNLAHWRLTFGDHDAF